MLRKYYEPIAGRLSWKLTLAWAAATVCGLLVTAYLSPAMGVFAGLASLAVLLLAATGADRSDELLDRLRLWEKGFDLNPVVFAHGLQETVGLRMESSGVEREDAKRLAEARSDVD